MCCEGVEGKAKEMVYRNSLLPLLTKHAVIDIIWLHCLVTTILAISTTAFIKQGPYGFLNEDLMWPWHRNRHWNCIPGKQASVGVGATEYDILIPSWSSLGEKSQRNLQLPAGFLLDFLYVKPAGKVTNSDNVTVQHCNHCNSKLDAKCLDCHHATPWRLQFKVWSRVPLVLRCCNLNGHWMSICNPRSNCKCPFGAVP